MKKLLTVLSLLTALILASCTTTGQVKISDMPTFIGDPAGGWVPIVIGGINRKIDASYLSANKSITYVVNSQDSMLSLPAKIGDFVVRTDSSKTYSLQALPASNASNWQLLLYPATVSSVNGRTGNVTAQAGDYNISQITGASVVAGTGDYNDLLNKPSGMLFKTDNGDLSSSNLFAPPYSGYQNTIYGDVALNHIKSGYGNTANGSGALGQDSSGYLNSAFGIGAIPYLLDGNNNLGFGYYSLSTLKHGNYNIGLGRDFGNSSDTTFSNTLKISDSTYHMQFHIDSASGQPANVISKDANGYWHVYQAPLSSVQSVAGKTGAVTLTPSDVGLDKVSNTVKTEYFADIPALQAYTGNATTAIVQDSTMGGIFVRQATGTADNAILFAASGGGYWKRKIDGLAINAQWFGLPLDSTTDARAALLKVFAAANNMKVVFPANKVYFISYPIQIILNNSQIDFNNCTFKIDNSWTQTWIFNLHNSVSTTLKNFNINGNKSVVSTSKQVIGIYFDSTKNTYVDNAHFYDIDYHALWVSYNPGISFGTLKFDNIYGATSSSDIYLSFDSTGDCSFNTIISNRDSYQPGQVVYDDAWNTNIKTIYANNASIVISYRIGHHTLGDVFATNCGALLYSQSDINTDLTTPWQFPSATVNSLNGINMKGEASTTSAIYINLCNNFTINSANISFDTTSSSRNYGVKVTEAPIPSSVNKLTLNNIRVLNPLVACYYFQKNTHPVYCSNLSGISKNQGFRSDSSLNYIYIQHPAVDSAGIYTKFVASGADMFRFGSDSLRRVGMTVQKFVDGVWVNQYNDSTQITANGSNGYLQKSTGANQLGNSKIYEDGTGVSVNTTTRYLDYVVQGYFVMLPATITSNGVQADQIRFYGTTAPAAFPNYWAGIGMANESQNYNNALSFFVGNVGVNSEKMRLTHLGYLAVNDTLASYPLDVNGQGRFRTINTGTPTDSIITSHAGLFQKIPASTFATSATTVNGHALNSNVTVTYPDIPSGAITNNTTATTQATTDSTDKIATDKFALQVQAALQTQINKKMDSSYRDTFNVRAPLAYNTATKTWYIDSTGTLKIAHIQGFAAATPTVTIGTDFTGNVSVTGTDVGGEITVTITSVTSYATLDPIVTLTFNSPYTTTPYVVFSPSSSSSGASGVFGGVYVKNTSTTGFTLSTVASGSTTTTTYKWTYHVTQ